MQIDWYTSKVIIFNFLIAFFAILSLIWPDFPIPLNAQSLKVGVAVVGVVNVILRFMTSKPVTLP